MENLSSNNIKGYELLERIGAGGFGAVYKAQQTTIGREVAIKIILPGFANQPDFIRRFEIEAQLVARLEHPYIVPLHDYWRDPNGAYLVMRYLRGGSLRDALETNPFDIDSTARLMEQIVGALSVAHRNQVIHRDLKPGNILLDEDGNAYLADFGIAKDIGIASNGKVTEPEQIIGSPDYLAPEQARSEPVTPQTDIYCLGVVLYEALTGQHPFPEMTGIERIFKHINDRLPLIENLDPAIQEDVNEVIQRATSKNPAYRYTDVLEMGLAFQKAIAIKHKPSESNVVELLTMREQEVLQLLVACKSNKEIADELFIEPSTVKWYNKQIFSKLGVRSRVQAIVRARELNLVVPSPEDGFAIVMGEASSTSQLPEPENPYKGLRAFQSADEKEFFGREKLIRKLISRLQEKGKNGRFLAVVGPSGSGKSSLVKAGLIPALWRGEIEGSEKWFIIDMLPSERPLDTLEVALMRIAADQSGNLHEQLQRDEGGLLRVADLILPNDNSELVVIIDQFEELFTLVEKEERRKQFLDILYAAVTAKRSRVRIVVTLRADFYDRPLMYPEFGTLVRDRTETVLPLTAEELERAIVNPAQNVGVKFEEGLAATIANEVSYQPGALPLLQYALTELFENRAERTLSHEAYQQIGGTVGALANRAEELYDELSEEAQEITRQMFLRLVTLGEGVEDTRRRTPRSELVAITTNDDLLNEIIDTFAEYRLFSLDHDPATRTPTVEVAHEAILREWERLRNWLNESRSDVQMQRQLAYLADEWRRSGQEESFLLRGTRLESFEAWMAETGLVITPKEREFLEASTAQHTREIELERQRREEKERLENRVQRVLQGLVAVFFIAAIVAGSLALFAFDQRATAEEERDNAQFAQATSDVNAIIAQEAQATSEANAMIAQTQRDEAQSLFLAAEAENALENGDTDLALALIPTAMELNPESEVVRRTLVRIASVGGAQLRLEGHPDRVSDVEFTPDGRQAVSLSMDGTAILWDIETGSPIFSYKPKYGDFAGNVTITPDGKQALLEYDDLVLWDLQTGEIVKSLSVPHFAYVWCTAFNSNGSFALSGSGEGHINLWDMATAQRIRLFDLYDKGITTLAFSPDDQIVLSTSFESAALWDSESGKIIRDFDEYAFPAKFSTDGQTVFSSFMGRNMVQWDVETGEIIQRYEREGYDIAPMAIAIHPDGSTIASGYFDGTLILWDVATGQQIGQLVGNRGETEDINFSPDGQMIISGSGLNDNAVRLWDVSSILNTRVFDGVGELSPDGTLMLLAPSHLNVRTTKLTDDSILSPLQIIDPASGQELYNVEIPEENSIYIDSAFSADGKYLVVNVFNREEKISALYLWALAENAPPKIIPGQFTQRFAIDTVPWKDALPMYSLAFGKGNQTIFGGIGFMHVWGGWNLVSWEVETGRQNDLSPRMHQNIQDIATAVDGTTLVIAEKFGVVSIWDTERADNYAIKILEGHTGDVNSVATDQQGYALSGGEDGTMILWDIAKGELVRQYSWNNISINAVAISPDGTLALAGNDDGELTLWNLQTGEIIHQFIGHKAPILDVQFYNDQAFSTAEDGTTRFWQLPPYRTVDEIVDWLYGSYNIRDFTCDEREYYNILPLCTE